LSGNVIQPGNGKTSLVSTSRIKLPPWRRLAGRSPQRAAWLVNVTRRSLAILLFCLACELLPRTGFVDRVFLPPFSEIILAAQRLVLSGALAEHAAASILRSSSGLALAILIAVPAGLIIGSNRRMANSSSRYWSCFAIPHRWRCCRSSP
jgi:ABC-type nitrate/sulfonate/bicarbonate transport system permease component